MAAVTDDVPRRDRSASLFSTDSYSHPRQWRRPAHAPETPEIAHSGERDAPNRRSFFGRALSDAAVRARMPTLHSTMSSQNALPHPPRPETSLSSARRRKTEPLQQIRDSIFGARKKATPPTPRDASSPQESWPLPGSDNVGRAGVLLSSDHFRSEQEYYRYLRKTTISPPFYFEHVTHTAKQELPPLETVHEKDLPGRFWSVSAYQRPKRQLTGIRADDLSEKLPAMGVERGAPSSRPTSPAPVELDTGRPLNAGSVGPVNGIDQTIFDEPREIKPDPTTEMRQSDKTSELLKHPLRKSSLTTLNNQRLECMDQLPLVQTVTEHTTSAAEDYAAIEQPSPTAPPNIQVVPPHADQQVSMLSPVISIAASDGEASAPGLSPKTLHFRTFDSVQRLSSDNLSDPESNSTLSSRNRTSCSSYDSAQRTAPTISTAAATAAQDTARWSATSSHSMPELMHSERRSRLALQKSSISRPLETLPQSPGIVAEVRKEAIIPRATRELFSLRKSLAMPHRPQSPGDRAAMQGVGRAASRSRPPTPGRFPARLRAVDEGRLMVGQRTGEWI
ncbi:hypothetical protein B0A54_02309 [Friedmanniomyces endolithicus]|uniref:CRIB domain-containing protein n=1 Tax=Friedmanniomyces endolithicus TaxID=329885 RepID=A0A4U0VBY5_9PEZI|nr:hypothetical protein B0A54_02309 [Friedmanniomyces endolithicus]